MHGGRIEPTVAIADGVGKRVETGLLASRVVGQAEATGADRDTAEGSLGHGRDLEALRSVRRRAVIGKDGDRDRAGPFRDVDGRRDAVIDGGGRVIDRRDRQKTVAVSVAPA